MSAYVSVTVWGPGACFTRPELRTERVSYPVITFPAAIGILDSIFRKPEFAWVIDSVDVLSSGQQWSSIMRNETSSVAANETPILTDVDREQRGMLYLKNVAYTIRATPLVKKEFAATNTQSKYVDMFNRRVKRGQCFSQPFFGTREFSAFFATPDSEQKPVNWTQPLGTMHAGFNYAVIKGKLTTTPIFAKFELNHGTLRKVITDV